MGYIHITRGFVGLFRPSFPDKPFQRKNTLSRSGIFVLLWLSRSDAKPRHCDIGHPRSVVNCFWRDPSNCLWSKRTKIDFLNSPNRAPHPIGAIYRTKIAINMRDIDQGINDSLTYAWNVAKRWNNFWLTFIWTWQKISYGPGVLVNSTSKGKFAQWQTHSKVLYYSIIYLKNRWTICIFRWRRNQIRG